MYKNKWVRKKCLLQVPADHSWWKSHAQCPVVHKISEQLWRIFFTGRDEKNRSAVLALDVDPSNEMSVVALHDKPFVSFGQAYEFDSHGIGISFLMPQENALLVYTGGVSLRPQKAHAVAMGLMISKDNGMSFQRYSQKPILSGPSDKPAMHAYPSILKIDETYHMWFSRDVRWDYTTSPLPEAYYDICHASSPNGIDWTVDEISAITLRKTECGLFRSWVRPAAQGGYEMWFCARGAYNKTQPQQRHYSLGYAFSADAKVWHRCDNAIEFINPPESSDWDSEMQCYPSVRENTDGNQYLFYCGNDYGRLAFGYAQRVFD